MKRFARHCGFGALALLSLGLPLVGGCVREKVERVEWTVMGTVAAVQWKGRVADSQALVREVREAFAEVETLLNAHAADSELSRLAKLPDAEVLAKCSPLVRPCYAAAFRLRDETGGVFNPRWRGPGTMDLGAIAKGFSVDLAAERIARWCGGSEVLIDLGGNLKAVSGVWQTGVVAPDANPSSRTAEQFSLAPNAACATSAEYYRGKHIKDGRDGSDAAGAVASVTAIHPDSAILADGLSTVMFLFGRERGEAFLRRRYPAAKAIWLLNPETQGQSEKEN